MRRQLLSERSGIAARALALATALTTGATAMTSATGMAAVRLLVAAPSILAASLLAIVPVAPPAWAAQTEPGNVHTGSDLAPWRLARSLAALRDRVARGEVPPALAIVAQRDLDAAIRALPPEGWRDPRNVDALFVHALSGGNRTTVLAAFDALPTADDRSHIADAIAAHVRRETGASAGLSEAAERAEGELRALILLTLGSNPDLPPTEARRHLRAAELAAPGTLTEEAALRRRLTGLLDPASGDGPHAARRWGHDAEAYLRRYSRSPYAAPVLRALVSAVAREPSGASALTERLLEALPDPLRGRFALEVGRKAVIAGNVGLAGAVLAEAGDGPRARLLRLVAEPGAPGDTYHSVASEVVPRGDRALLEAARTLSREIDRDLDAHLPEPIPAQPSGEFSAGPASDEDRASLARDEAFFARDEALFDEIDALLERAR